MKKSLIIAVLAAGLPCLANAATINGQIDVVANVNLNTSSFTPTGFVDLNPSGIVVTATGDYVNFATPFVTPAVFDDIVFTAPGTIWTAGGFSFTANSFSNLINTSTIVAFQAQGVITGNGFDATDAVLSFSAQPLGGLSVVSVSTSTSVSTVPIPTGLLLLSTALIGMGMASRKPA